MDDIQKDFENKPGSLSSMYEKGNCQTFCMVGRGYVQRKMEAKIDKLAVIFYILWITHEPFAFWTN